MQRAYASGMSVAMLTPQEMSEADRIAIETGPFDGYFLMQAAGRAVFAEVLRRFAGATGFDVLCGPGNNGGDGYVVARLLEDEGHDVRVWAESPPRPGSDAAVAAAACSVSVRSLETFHPTPGSLVIDALYGAGLAREIGGAVAKAAEACRQCGAVVVAIDLPSGVSGASGKSLGPAFEAAITVTFFRRKPGHVLEPGRSLCGETIVAGIGIPESVLDTIRPQTFVNDPVLWNRFLTVPRRDQHKYSRGAVAVFSGGVTSTGAGRLSAMAAARIGAGAVTVYSPASAISANAAHLTSIMLRKVDDRDDLAAALAARAPDAVVLGPGFELPRGPADMTLAVLQDLKRGILVLDADGITAFRDRPEALFGAVGASSADLVLTPHEGEFVRLFPDIASDRTLSKPDKARQAAKRAGGVIVYKGPDTVIASPDGKAVINANGSPWLATAGSGDVLAGFIAGLGAQGVPSFDAACAAVWLHAEAASRFGLGLIAEDLPGLVPGVLRDLMAMNRRASGEP